MILTLLFQFSKTQDDPDADSVPFFHPIQTDSNKIHPSLAVVIGVLFIFLFITLFFVAYTKFCVTNPLHFNNQLDFHGLIRSGSRLSGLDRTVVESLPFFRFSSLKGFKQGLECAVCISKFQEIEILRLLPNCNHAFHIDCIDRWLENHSTCPLCRYKIDAGDLQNFIYSNSSRSLARKVPSNLTVTEDLNLELFIQREQAHDHDQHHDSSSRFKVGISSFRKNMDTKFLHKLKHKIVISDAVVRNRWSDVNSSDFLSLNSEMLGVMSSQRFSPTESNSKINASDSVPTLSCFPSTSSSICTEQSSTGQLLINTSEKRSMSEITNLSRFTEFNIISNYNKLSKGSGSDVNSSKEERMKSIWLQIARGTVKWFAGTERISEDFKYKRQPLNV